MERPKKKLTPPSREIKNENLFADDIVFSDTEKILFEKELLETPPINRDELTKNSAKDRYTIIKKINEGGMKTIWEVEDNHTARKLSMAIIQDSKIATEDDVESFLYEARLTANLQHPNIVPIYDVALDESGNPYFTMKILKGETLGEIIEQLRNGNTEYIKLYTRSRLLGIFLKVCNAIDYAHTKGVLHLDLKPSNIVVGDFGDVQVLDWGLSILTTHLSEYGGGGLFTGHEAGEYQASNKILKRYLKSPEKHRKTIGGTPGYMSAEQAQSLVSKISFQTDIYALGTVLYEMLTYHCPFTGDSTKEILEKTVRGNFLPPRKKAPDLRIPKAIAAIAAKAMNSDPARRYPNVAALIGDIEKHQDGYATIAQNPTFLTHAALLVKRHAMVVGLIAASLAIIVIILLQSFVSIKKSERIALGARNLATQRLEELQKKRDYIASTAKRVAPDYLKLMVKEENDYSFNAAEQALNTGLTLDPSLATGWLWKGKMLLCQQKFSEAWTILSGKHGNPVRNDATALILAEKIRDWGQVPDTGISELVKEFKISNMAGGIPRLFYHINQAPFNPETRFPAIVESLRLLNPENEMLNFSWESAGPKGWVIDISNNPHLEDISPLCGLDIYILKASNIGTPDLKLLTEDTLRELRISGAQLNNLFVLDQMSGLKVLDISNTHIRDLTNIMKYPKLVTLDISNIEDLVISQQLLRCRNLKQITIDKAFHNNPTVRALARRKVTIVFPAR